MDNNIMDLMSIKGNIEYMKEAASMLKIGCRTRFNTDEYGDFECDCPIHVPKHWGVE